MQRIMFTTFPNTFCHCLKKKRSLYEVLQAQDEISRLKKSKAYSRFKRVLMFLILQEQLCTYKLAKAISKSRFIFRPAFESNCFNGPA